MFRVNRWYDTTQVSSTTFESLDAAQRYVEAKSDELWDMWGMTALTARITWTIESGDDLVEIWGVDGRLGQLF